MSLLRNVTVKTWWSSYCLQMWLLKKITVNTFKFCCCQKMSLSKKNLTDNKRWFCYCQQMSLLGNVTVRKRHCQQVQVLLLSMSVLSNKYVLLLRNVINKTSTGFVVSTRNKYSLHWYQPTSNKNKFITNLNRYFLLTPYLFKVQCEIMSFSSHE